jgi:hypothetical protein
MSTITRVGFAGGDSDGAGEPEVTVVALEQMMGQMDTLLMTLTETDLSRATVDEKLSALSDSVERLTHRLGESNPTNTALLRVAEGQERLLEHLSDRPEVATADAGLDAESRMRLRSIDVQMLRILEEISAGRQETMTEIRTDLAALSRILHQAGPNRRQED